jgi:hypothetical protein
MNTGRDTARGPPTQVPDRMNNYNFKPNEFFHKENDHESSIHQQQRRRFRGLY